jgi:hypothetical protein
MNSDKFLWAVADYYFKAAQSGKIDISELCLVFPNKRAAIFFRRYFVKRIEDTSTDIQNRISFVPNIMTIGAFHERFYSNEIADRIQLQFILYKAYCNVLTDRGLSDKIKTFERFAFLGDMILTDFDDIDKEMIDADELYVNLERYNEISSKYLSEDQIEVIQSIWGKDIISGLEDRKSSDDEGLWNHERTSQKFLKFWQILNPLYKEFRKLLEERKLAYPGQVSREIAQIICKGDGLKAMPFHRLGFVGFNIVSASLEKMMAYLRDNNAADFFWDLLPDIPYAERAGAYIRKLNHTFPMPEGYVPPTDNIQDCRIMVYGIPSNSLQAKAAGGVLDHWKNSTDANGNSLIKTYLPDNTVIVLPDQSLLSPMLNALPQKLGTVNITMGLSYRDTPFATLLRAIVSLHIRSHEIYHEDHFFHEDISTLIANPNMRAIALDSCLAIRAYLDRYHQYNVSAERLRNEIRKTGTNADGTLTPGAEALLCIFDVVPNKNSLSEAQRYISNLMTALNNALRSTGSNINKNAHEVKVMRAYQEAIDHVFNCIEQYSIKNLSESSIFGMLERLLAVSTLNMSGTPLSGLQIMGVLETRAIDFENVIVMSMNEDVYPRRNRQHSLIPQFLRSAYHLPTTGNAEQEYSYYFFRLFSRSKRVVCLYDSRTTGSGNGAMSRYLLQIQHLYPQAKIAFETCSLFAKQTDDRIIKIKKADVERELEEFKTKGDDKPNLSATALKQYRKCQLAFYLKYVKRVREDDEPTAFMDAATYGNVMHHVLKDLFVNRRKDKTSNTPVEINAEAISVMKKDDILGRVKREINWLYHQNSFKTTDRLPAESLILSEIMSEFINSVLDRELQYIKQYGNFYFFEAENKIIEQWEVKPGLKVNFRFDIDRHDILNDGTHRFVDYKTGGDKTEISSIEGLFQTTKKTSNDAALQLLTYAAAYSDLRKATHKIRPSLYRLKAAMTENIDVDDDWLILSTGKERLEWVNDGKMPDWQKTFRNELENMISSIFDGKGYFEQTTEIENCRYCPFLQMCSRIVPENPY